MASSPPAAPAWEAGGPEIAFFDLETSVPQWEGQRHALLEFGVILVCPWRLVEVATYATLVRPADLRVVSANTVRSNGITRAAVASAPPFRDVADVVYQFLHGRVWAGHNIVTFDFPILMEAFAEIGCPHPEPKGMIDTLPLLTQRFGRRAGDMKMASLANYFGLGRQQHRSLDDVRMNIEVVKNCATVLFLEESLPLTAENLAERITWSQGNQIELIPNTDEMKLDGSPQMDASSSGFSGYLGPDDVSTDCIKISVSPFYHFTRKTYIKHKGSPLQLCCTGLTIQFEANTKFLDNVGLPKLNIGVGIPENLNKVLDFCDDLAQKSSRKYGSISKWRTTIKKYGYVNGPIIRLKIPIIVRGNTVIYSTDMFQKEPNGNIQKLVFSEVDITELNTLFVRGKVVDAFFALEPYDYPQNAGIQLVAKKLVVHA